MKFNHETGIIYEPAISGTAQLLVQYVKSFSGGKNNIPNATKSSKSITGWLSLYSGLILLNTIDLY